MKDLQYGYQGIAASQAEDTIAPQVTVLVVHMDVVTRKGDEKEGRRPSMH